MTAQLPPTTDEMRAGGSSPNADFVRRMLLGSAGATLLLLVIAFTGAQPLMTYHYLFHQDLVATLAIVASTIVMALAWRRTRDDRVLPPIDGRTIALIAVGIAIVCAIGFHAVLWGRDFSRDEQMALFDARSIAAGQRSGIIPDVWLPWRSALNTVFMDPALSGRFWASTYRPVNAALHAIGVIVGAPHIVGPIFAGVALVATWRAARLMWPDQPEAATVATVMLALSAQFLVTGMTAYAMTPLLAFNMVWLLLVWRDDWRGHVGALIVGFLGTGLHQVLYHPLFAIPVCALFVWQRRWRLAALYALAYLAFIVGWVAFSGLRADWIGIVAPQVELASMNPASATGGVFAHAMELLGGFSGNSFAIQAANLVRLITWQHLLFVPLLIAGSVHARRTRDMRLVSLIAIVALAIVVKTMLRPYQGHGWGYRYLHGALGAAALLCAGGWVELRRRGIANSPVFVAASAATLVALIPLRLVQAHQFSGLFAQPARTAMATGADIVIVDDSAAPFAQDIAIADPFVRNRPVVLLASQLDPADIATLCARGSMAAIDAHDLAPINAAFGTDRLRLGRSADATMVAARTCAAQTRLQKSQPRASSR